MDSAGVQLGLQGAAMGVNALAGGLPVGTLALGLYQTLASAKKRKDLSKVPESNYEITPEMQAAYTAALNRAKYGFDPRQKGAFLNNLSSSNNQMYQRAIDLSGGQMSGALSRMMASNNIRGLNQLAADDARLQMANQQYADSLGRDISNQRNMKTSNEIRKRMMLEQALGTAGAQGLNNMATGVNYAAQMGFGKKDPVTTPDYNGNMSYAYNNPGYAIPQDSPMFNGGSSTPKPKYNPLTDPYNGTAYNNTNYKYNALRGY